MYANAAPAAGNHIFQAYLKPVDSCDFCHAEFRDIRTDDIAPYFTILIVGHIIAPLLFYVETTYAPAVWIHWTIWPAMTVLLSLWCLPRVKGAALAVMWHLRLQGDVKPNKFSAYILKFLGCRFAHFKCAPRKKVSYASASLPRFFLEAGLKIVVDIIRALNALCNQACRLFLDL